MKLSLVIPVFNEQEVLPLTLASLRRVLDALQLDYEILFIDDGSRDQTAAVLAAVSARDERVKVLRFSRNFGHQVAVTAGLDFASGDAMIVMDADLQDPPELIPEMVRLYEEGFDIVSPQRVSRHGDTWFKRKTAKMFYSLMNRMVDCKMPEEVGDFRLLSRGAVTALGKLREQHRFMRGMVAWLGLREALLPFERQPRAAGETKYPLWKMLRFSWTAVTSFSATPLRLTMALGFVACVFAFVYLAFAVFEALVYKNVAWGWTSVVFLQCFFFGMTVICIGLIGDYVARIYEESKGRPLYVINDAINVTDPVQNSRVVVVPGRLAHTVAVGEPGGESRKRS
jgi:polyisoprenyl-phosphate glycosyltransferase